MAIPTPAPASPNVPETANTFLNILHGSFVKDGPWPYLYGAGAGAVIVSLARIANPVAGAFLGVFVLPFREMQLRTVDFGTSLMARVAAWACVLFLSFSIGTFLTAACGLEITILQGSLLMLAGLVATVAFISRPQTDRAKIIQA